MIEDIWDEMVEKYGIHGYDNSSVIINYKTLIELTEKADRLNELLVIYKRHYGNVIEYAIELQEKAEKWDKWKPVTCIELVDKIEAISNWINEQPKCIRGSLKLKELEKILAGEA